MADLSASVRLVVWYGQYASAATLPNACAYDECWWGELSRVWLGKDCCWLDAHWRRVLAGVRLDMCLMLWDGGIWDGYMGERGVLLRDMFYLYSICRGKGAVLFYWMCWIKRHLFVVIAKADSSILERGAWYWDSPWDIWGQTHETGV